MKRFSSGGCYADITPKERAIANGQRSFVSFLLLQLSNSFLRILAVPNKAVFCKSPVLIVTPSFSSHASNLLLTTPSAPTTTGTTSRCLIPHRLPISPLIFSSVVASPNWHSILIHRLAFEIALHNNLVDILTPHHSSSSRMTTGPALLTHGAPAR